VELSDLVITVEESTTSTTLPLVDAGAIVVAVVVIAVMTSPFLLPPQLSITTTSPSLWFEAFPTFT
jgi:hypothetical protein